MFEKEEEKNGADKNWTDANAFLVYKVKMETRWFGK